MFDRKLKFSILQTSFAEMTNAVVQFCFIFSLPFLIPKDSLGIFFSYKAVVASFLVLFRLALDIALTRYLGFYSENLKKQKQVFSSILVLFVFGSVISVLVLVLFSDFLAVKFFDGNLKLVLYVGITLFFHGIYRICYCFYQGKSEIKFANILSVSVYSGGHFVIILLLFFKIINSVETIILCSSLIFLVSLIPFVKIIFRNFVFDFEFKELLEYSIPRIPHMLLSGFLMSANVMLAKYFFSNKAAGDLGITTRMFQIIGMFAYSFNMVLLPKVSALIGKGEGEELKKSMGKYVDVTMYIGTVGSFLFFTITPHVLGFLPSQYQTAEVVLKIFSFAILPYTVYIMLRSVIHGVDKKPIQLYVDLSSVSVLFVVFFVFRVYESNPLVLISVSMTASIFTSGIFSIVYLLLKLNIKPFFQKWVFHMIFIVILCMLSQNFWIFSLVMFFVFEGLFGFNFVKRSLKS